MLGVLTGLGSSSYSTNKPMSTPTPTPTQYYKYKQGRKAYSRSNPQVFHPRSTFIDIFVTSAKMRTSIFSFLILALSAAGVMSMDETPGRIDRRAQLSNSQRLARGLAPKAPVRLYDPTFSVSCEDSTRPDTMLLQRWFPVRLGLQAPRRSTSP
jgi:hypothetical protein